MRLHSVFTIGNLLVKDYGGTDRKDYPKSGKMYRFTWFDRRLIGFDKRTLLIDDEGMKEISKQFVRCETEPLDSAPGQNGTVAVQFTSMRVPTGFVYNINNSIRRLLTSC